MVRKQDRGAENGEHGSEQEERGVKKYDRAMKLVVDANPEAIAQFVLQQWRLTAADAIQEEAHVVEQLSPEFPGTEAAADGLILMRTVSGKEFIVHIEFQSTNGGLMFDRLLDYCIRTRRKHGLLPIVSCVIHLRDDGNVQKPPGSWLWPDGSPCMLFKYVCIKLYELPRETILDLHQPALLPLSLLTEGKVEHIMVREIFEVLLENKLNDLLPVGQTIAAVVLDAMDLEWLKKEYYKMTDLFRDSPVFDWVAEDAHKKGLAQGREEARQQLEKSRQQIQEDLEEFRQTIVLLVAERFPKLERLAKKQVQTTDDIKLLQQAILHCSRAQDSTEAEIVLLDLDKE